VLPIALTGQLDFKRPLIGQELVAHQDKLRAVEAAEAKQKALLERSRRLREAAGNQNEASDSESDDDDAAPPAATNGVNGHDDDAMSTGDGEREVMRDLTNDADRQLGTGGDTETAATATIRAAANWDEFVDAGDAQPMTGGGFDTYVRGQVARRLEYSVPAPGATADERPIAPTRLRLFPFVERRRRVDQYGEVIDIQGWLSRGKTVEGQQATANATSSSDFGAQARDSLILGKRKRDDADDKPEEPHRFVTESINVQARCTIFAVDMEGKADGRALRTLLPNLNPKKLVRSVPSLCQR